MNAILFSYSEADQFSPITHAVIVREPLLDPTKVDSKGGKPAFFVSGSLFFGRINTVNEKRFVDISFIVDMVNNFQCCSKFPYKIYEETGSDCPTKKRVVFLQR